MDSPFDVLGIDPDADEDEISRAYRRRVIETHPDQGGSAAALQRVRWAYEQLESGEWSEEDGERLDPIDEDARQPNSGNGVQNGQWESQQRNGGRTQKGTRVEYLNYEVLDDHGWSLDDDDLFEKAAAAGLEETDYGRILVEEGEDLLDAAEDCGFAWPYACRGGACANCAVAVTEGEMEMPAGHILRSDMLDRGFQLSCIGRPTTDDLKVVFNVKHLPDLDELRLPASRFEQAKLDD